MEIRKQGKQIAKFIKNQLFKKTFIILLSFDIHKKILGDKKVLFD